MMQFLSTISDYPIDDYAVSQPALESGSSWVELAWFLTYVAVYAIMAWRFEKTLEKVGLPGWKAWVPYYNLAVFMRLGGQSIGWLLLYLFAPTAGAIAGIFALFVAGSLETALWAIIAGGVIQLIGYIWVIIAAHNINNGFGKGAGHTVLFFFSPMVWLIFISRSENKWNGPRLGSKILTNSKTHPAGV